MGFYFASYLYQGRLLCKIGFTRVKRHVSAEILEEFVTQLTPERWVIHAPTRYLQIGSSDPILEKHEVTAGRVSWAEALGNK